MKKFLLLMFLLASSVSAAAETWVPISPPNEAGQSFYSPSSMRRSGDIVEVWSMHDLTKPEVIENRAVFLWSCYRELTVMIAFIIHWKWCYTMVMRGVAKWPVILVKISKVNLAGPFPEAWPTSLPKLPVRNDLEHMKFVRKHKCLT